MPASRARDLPAAFAVICCEDLASWPDGHAVSPPLIPSGTQTNFRSPTMPPSTKPWTMTTRATATAWTTSSLETDGDAVYRLERGRVGGGALRRLAHAERTPIDLFRRPGLGAFAVARGRAFITADAELLRLDSGGAVPARLASIPGIHRVAVVGRVVLTATGDTRIVEGSSDPRATGQLISVPVQGGPTTLLTDHGESSPRLAADATRAFVAEARVIAVPLLGGAVHELAHDARNPFSAIAAADGWLYVISGDELRRVSVQGGQAMVVYRGGLLMDVRLHSGFAYIARNLVYDRGLLVEPAAILRVPLAGGPSELLCEVRGRLAGMAVDDSGVYALVAPLSPSGSEPDRVLALRPSP